jgi:hypothetical protein
MRSTTTIILFILLFASQILAQYDNIKIHEGLDGEALLEKIVEDYKPVTILTYSQCRDTMFAKIYMQNDSLSCVYTDHTLYLDPNEDPTSYVYLDGINDGINTEHTYPRSKGAENGNARSDMHHLFPTRLKVNADRGNLPFAEIPDPSTTKWYYKNQLINSIPSANIDAYSEGTAQGFEPREDHKGNVARAIFYFYTMYKDQADAADSDFFQSQVETLCEWHTLDPVDSLEWHRSIQIGSYQDDKANPFVLDCSLAGRTYCDMISNACSQVPVFENPSIEHIDMHLFPNPANESLTIECNNDRVVKFQAALTDLNGREVWTTKQLSTIDADHKVSMDVQTLESGIYLLNAHFVDQFDHLYISKKIVIF